MELEHCRLSFYTFSISSVMNVVHLVFNKVQNIPSIFRFRSWLGSGPVSTGSARDSSVESRIKTQSPPPKRIKITLTILRFVLIQLLIIFQHKIQNKLFVSCLIYVLDYSSKLNIRRELTLRFRSSLPSIIILNVMLFINLLTYWITYDVLTCTSCIYKCI